MFLNEMKSGIYNTDGTYFRILPEHENINFHVWLVRLIFSYKTFFSIGDAVLFDVSDRSNGMKKI